jgi:anaerobic magnesium-protoporphyrin IX monomethyl ester cyclase
MRVVLINPPFSHIYGAYKPAARVAAVPQMPLGLTYLAAAVRGAGHQALIKDCEVEDYSHDDELTDDIVGLTPDVVAVTATTPLIHKANEIIDKIRSRAEILTVLGGVHVSSLLGRVYDEECSADVCVYGEGEETLVEILDAHAQNRSFHTINGVLFKDASGKTVQTSPRVPPPIESLPHPARDLLRTDKYRWSIPGKGLRSVTSLITHRGCPFRCVFCSVHSVFPRTPRYRSVDSVVAELQEIVREHGIHHVMIQDDTLTLNRELISALCTRLIDLRMDVTFEGYTRADLVDESLLSLMKRAGLVRLSFGVESGDRTILKAIRKDIQPEDYVRAYRTCRELGIETRCSYMIGHPFETRESIQRTIRFVNSLDVRQAYINISTPYPGSELFRMAKDRIGGLELLTEDWRAYCRYGSPVIRVNALTPEDLRRYQRWAYLRFYLRPEIVWYNLRRAGFKAALINSLAFLKAALLSPLLRTLNALSHR